MRTDLGQASRGRILDFTLSAVLLLAALPVMALVALAIYVEDGRPVLFVQPRLGLGRRVFHCLKFRSMVVDAEDRLADVLAADPAARAEWDRTQKLQRDPRITAVGRVIRKLSLDELPQLLNVLRGDMSLVGPRPIVEAEVARYGRRIAYYAAVRPGLTGLWQVRRSSGADYRTRVAMDVIYVRSKGVALDLRILAATLPAVILTRGSH